MEKNFRIETKIIHSFLEPDQETRTVSQPVVPAVAYSFPDADTAASVVCGDMPGVYYGRYGNPTVEKLEKKIAELEDGEAALGVSSGMAAISAAILSYCQNGDHLLVTKDVYGGTHSFMTGLAPRFGITSDFIDCTDFQAIEDAIQPNTKAVYIETPSNPLLTVLDIHAIAMLCKRYDLPLIVDNTFMTPYLQKPLELGADLVVHSATKYLNGHGDVIAGFVVGTQEKIQFIRKQIMGDLGQNLNAWEAYLILRGLKTLAIRVKQHCSSARKVANFLENHAAIEQVFYPGLASHSQYTLAQKQMSDAGGMISFEVKGGIAAGKDFINALELIMISFSLGDPESLIQHPASMTHYSIPQEERAAFGITDGLLRLSVGLEDPDDLIEDLDQALIKLNVEETVEETVIR